MFCPKCKAEYREGFYRCADCDIDLVYELPMPSSDEPPSRDESPGTGKFAKLLTAVNDGEIAFLKSLLESTDIPYYFKTLAYRITRPEQAPASLMIEETRLEEAKELLKDFRSKE